MCAVVVVAAHASILQRKKGRAQYIGYDRQRAAIFIAPNNWLQNKIFLLVNKNSLGVYLYHPLFQSGIYTYILHDKAQKSISDLGAVGVFVCVMTGTLGLVWILKKWWVTDKYMLGNLKRTH